MAYTLHASVAASMNFLKRLIKRRGDLATRLGKGVATLASCLVLEDRGFYYRIRVVSSEPGVRIGVAVARWAAAIVYLTDPALERVFSELTMHRFASLVANFTRVFD